MQGKPLKIAVMGALLGVLGGCIGSGANDMRASAAPSLDALFGVEDLADGKTALRQGNMSLAISAFRRAIINPQTAGEAFNGLGIAYARLGRADLAEANFTKAIALTPGDTRFSANLSRLYRSEAGERMLAQRQAAAARYLAKLDRLERKEAETEAHARTVSARRGPLTIVGTKNRIVRKDAKELFLVTERSESGQNAIARTAVASQIAEQKPVRLREMNLSSLMQRNAAGRTSSDIVHLGNAPAKGTRAPYRLRVNLPVDADY